MPHDSRQLRQKCWEARGLFRPAAEGRGHGVEGEEECACRGGRVGPGRRCAGRTQLGRGSHDAEAPSWDEAGPVCGPHASDTSCGGDTGCHQSAWLGKELGARWGRSRKLRHYTSVSQRNSHT